MAEKKKATKRVAKRVEAVEKTPMNRNLVYIFYSIGIVLCVALAQYFTMKDVNENVLASVSYGQQHTIDYRVFYQENQFYDEIYMGEDQTYVASLTDEIEIDNVYYTYFDKRINLSYKYDVIGKLVVHEPGNASNVYWTKDYELKKGQTINLADAKELRIKDSVVIDFQKYRKIWEDYKAESRLSSDAVLYVTFKVDPINVTFPGINDFKYNAILKTAIPVSENTFKITEDASYLKDKQVVKNAEIDNADKVYSMIIAALLWFLGILLGLFFILTYHNDVKKQGAYSRKLKKILSTFDNIIVDVEKLPVLAGLSVVNVTDFEELVDAQSEVRLPINFKEDAKKKVAKFILVRNNLAWVYTLKEDSKED